MVNFSSLLTFSYWRYALLTKDSISQFLAAIGTLYLLAEILDFFGVYPREMHSRSSFVVMLALSLAYVLITRRPVNRITYKVPRKDFCYVVRVGDLLGSEGDIVISTNTTFDTDTASGLIAPNSLQGQMVHRFFSGNTAEVDRQISDSLRDEPWEDSSSPGKNRRYPIGTVAKIGAHGKNFYLLAMADLNAHGTAVSSNMMVDTALEKLWDYIAAQGELADISVPLIGTGRGRIEWPRRKIIERIAQSFADASRDRVFSNKLSIVVHPEDARKYDVNLFEVRDYLCLSLHV